MTKDNYGHTLKFLVDYNNLFYSKSGDTVSAYKYSYNSLQI